MSRRGGREVNSISRKVLASFCFFCLFEAAFCSRQSPVSYTLSCETQGVSVVWKLKKKTHGGTEEPLLLLLALLGDGLRVGKEVLALVGRAGLGELADVELLGSLGGEVLLVGLRVVLLLFLDNRSLADGSGSALGGSFGLGVGLGEDLSLELLLAVLGTPASCLGLLRVTARVVGRDTISSRHPKERLIAQSRINNAHTAGLRLAVEGASAAVLAAGAGTTEVSARVAARVSTTRGTAATATTATAASKVLGCCRASRRCAIGAIRATEEIVLRDVGRGEAVKRRRKEGQLVWLQG